MASRSLAKPSLFWLSRAASTVTTATKAAGKSMSDSGKASKNTFFATTPIFYVNAKPHVGHLYSMVLTDCLHRWQKLLGYSSIMATGTDEHGNKVLQAATAAGLLPQDFVDSQSANFKQLAERAHIDFYRYIRTTDADHVVRAQKFWQVLQERGMIYKGTHAGWYCVSDETFVPEVDLQTLEDGTKITIESQHPVHWVEESNYFFKLSAMRDQLISYLQGSSSPSTETVRPSARRDQLINELKTQVLPDLSISRPKSRCDWGIPVPADEDQVMYVWLDALVNYVTIADSFNASTGKVAWPADVHVVGKDIMRFHCVYWPAFLIAAGMEPPRSVLVHAHWTLGGFKMSKSKKNVVDPLDALDKYGVDSVRYFLLHDGNLHSDTPFSFKGIVDRHNFNLANKVGNLVNRVCAPKFNIEASIKSCTTIKGDSSLLDICTQMMANMEPSKALQKINTAAIEANQLFQSLAPWNATGKEQAQAVAEVADRARVISLLLQPFCPTYSARLLDRLAVSKDKRSAEFCKLGADFDFGHGANRKGPPPLPKLPEVIDETAEAPAVN